jgi:hypothetical protein
MDSINSTNEDCDICGISLNKGYTHELSCNHKFHYECLVKTFKMNKTKYSTLKKRNNCPLCRSPSNYLPIVNGLKKIEIGIHISRKDFLNQKGLNEIYSYNLTHLNNTKCNFVMKRGKRKGEVCGKNCKLGYEMCGIHVKI